MGKIDIEFRSNSRQSSIGCVKQGICGKIIHRSEPFALEYSPQCLCDIQMRTIWREKEKVQASLFPYRPKFLHEFAPVHAGIVKHHECILADTHRQSVKKVCDFISLHVLRCREALILVITVNHTEDIEPEASFRRDIHILSTELPAIGHIAFRADMAFISVVEVYQAGCCLSFEFLQLLGLVRIELRRGLTLWTFPYTSISRANADKKALNVLSLASLPDACCQASFALITLCLSFSMAIRTASSSEQSIIGFRPRPGRVSKPLMPSTSNRFTHELTDIWGISVCTPTSLEVRPLDFRSIARQRIRKAWLLPWRKPSSTEPLLPQNRIHIKQKKSPEELNPQDSRLKRGGYLLSRIALQYHRRKWA